MASLLSPNLRSTAATIALLVTVGHARAEEPPAAPLEVRIGGGESDPHPHAQWSTVGRLTRASVRVTIDKTDAGLNFFAIQVDFPNGTWAHGGLQDVADKDGSRRRQVNWGGLVAKGGGATDYAAIDDAADLDRMQNPPAAEHDAPYPWKDGRVYEFTVERGAQVTLPPGDYQYLPSHPPVHVDHARALWTWRFTVRPVDDPGAPTFSGTLYDAADHVGIVLVWNEHGSKSRAENQHAIWRALTYRSLEAPGRDTPVVRVHRN